MSESRVVAPKGKIGTRPPATETVTPSRRAEDQEPPTSSKRRVPGIIIGIVVIAALVAGYWFYLGPGAGGEGEEGAGEVVEVGAIQQLDPVSLNLAGGHYLRLGLGLQLSAEASGEVDAAIALDAAIVTFSGYSVDELADLEVRSQLKQALLDKLQEPYSGEVIGIYYTDFVTQ